MSSELLREAAKVLREHAEAATPGPWEHVDCADPSGQPMTKEGLPSTFMGCGSVISMGEAVAGVDVAAPNGDLYPRSGYSPADDMRLIARMHPPVALALAGWLEVAANAVDQFGGIFNTAYPEDEAAFALARAILRRSE